MTQTETSSPVSIAVLGGGSFGTAIANIVAGNGHDTRQWMRDPEKAASCRKLRENTFYLPGVPLHPELNITSDLEQAVSGCGIVIVAIPSKSFRQVVKTVAPMLAPGTMLISTTKGIEHDSFHLMSDILLEETSDMRVGVLSGPNFAKEIVEGHYTATVIASEHEELCKTIQSVLHSETFRVYSSNDVFGVELAGALKNIYAIVTGMAKALGRGGNTTSLLITRALAEMMRFAEAMGADPMTFIGLAGVGDLILTCSSDLSRNYRVGYLVGKGMPLEQAIAEIGQVAEGVNTVRLIKRKADELGVYMPLVSAIHAILFEERPIPEVIRDLMSGAQTFDVAYSAKS
ncbi:NAD(P)H-dependent glycerol-3-phosphate dehydrogenase [Microbulbifer flavimaris]|uniref:Glycerol-3-phosphate dehydrogenase [NAD(P)+] n=1 Tax=Microbulbifer flavimaris TaxID=1781068 RepID=A0ABX4I319_9GAMM|nr:MULTISPECIES: NAD(P)H-dependent glycerol-3-phosphate dehydrogenase [Microbulbifer]KUJ84219.1 glycerol-3-phosphate dehydrogenase [Microbulbifer sp. ZGT114]PCO06295.1 NAD(P)H-dependent glycerol-3-phosphate dehydrogenase [Microbulbifer flavimaris]